MTPYFLYFFFTALLVVKPFSLDQKLEKLLWGFAICFGALFIGLRHEVGGDWINYIYALTYQRSVSFSDWFDFTRFDVGYQIVAYVGSSFGLGIYGVNLLCGLIVMVSLAYFAKRQPYPWLTMLLAIPFFIIGINMGTVRQGLALSFSLVALTTLNNSSRKYIFWIFLAFLFHKSSLAMILLVFVKKFSLRTLVISLISLLAIYYLLKDIRAISILLNSYLYDPDYQSEGAIIRILVSSMPAIGLLLFYKNLNERFPDTWIYLWISIGTMILFILAPSFSTLADRLAYYTIPLQLAIWPRIIFVQKNQLIKQYFTLSVMFGYLAMLYVWLNFANHSWAWIPYQMIWFGEQSINAQTLCLNGYCQ